MSTTVSTRTIPGSTGPEVQLHVSECGAGPSIRVLIHGFGEGSQVWTDFAGRLSEHTRVLSLDLRGHGNSTWDPNERYSTKTHCEDVIEFLRSIQTRRLILIGHSMGAEIITKIVTSDNANPIGIVLVDYGPGTDEEVIDHMLEMFNIENKIYSSVNEYMEYLLASRPLMSADIAPQFARDSLQPHPSGGYRLKRDPALGKAENFEIEPDDVIWRTLERIRCPIQLIRGRGSAVLTPDVAKDMSHRLLDCTLNVIEVAGHSVMLDNPLEFYKVCQSFLRHVAKTH